MLPGRYILKKNDEGVHANNFFKLREWWYYNVLFNDPSSDLKKWSITICFISYPAVDSFKIVLHDDKRKSYGNTYIHPKGTLKIKKDAVNVKYRDSRATGMYPEWDVIGENIGLGGEEIYADLKFKAKSLPMWLIKNTGYNLSSSPVGYYCVMKCDAKGKIKFQNKEYNVKGLGYYDHTWSPIFVSTGKKKQDKIVKKKGFMDSEVWDWFCIHLTNGWDIFVGKINTSTNSSISKIIPGSLAITPDGKHLLECLFFNIEDIEYEKTSVESIKIPKKLKISCKKLRTSKHFPIKGPITLELNYETENITEMLFTDRVIWGQWESTGRIYGEIKGRNTSVKLNGWAVMETTHRG